MTMQSSPSLTRGPPVLCSLSLVTMPMPMKPVSDEPIESVITELGSSSRYWFLTVCENSAALLDTAKTDDAS